MKAKKLSIFCVAPLLIGCATNTNVELKDYVKDFNVTASEGFTILSMQDIHLCSLSILDTEFKYYEKVIRSKGELDGTNKLPDLIIFNGDTFMDTNRTVVKKFFKWLDGLDIPFVYTYGNHDLQGQYSSKFMDEIIKSCKNAKYFSNPNDKLTGDSNCVINVKQGDEIKWQIYTFDSNTYYGFNYDVVHDDQIQWYKDETEAAKTSSGYVPNVTFMHIPFEEFNEAWQEYGDGKLGGGIDKNGNAFYMGEEVSQGYKENDLFESMATRNAKGVICAHDHVNNTDWNYSKNGSEPVRLIYGTKTGHGIYHDPRTMGGSFITLHDDATFDLYRTTVSYEDDVPSYYLTDAMLAALEYVAC